MNIFTVFINLFLFTFFNIDFTKISLLFLSSDIWAFRINWLDLKNTKNKYRLSFNILTLNSNLHYHYSWIYDICCFLLRNCNNHFKYLKEHWSSFNDKALNDFDNHQISKNYSQASCHRMNHLFLFLFHLFKRSSLTASLLLFQNSLFSQYFCLHLFKSKK